MLTRGRRVQYANVVVQ